MDFTLGDAVMEQGCLPEAIEAYQTMVNLRPDLHAYARIAHIRWLKGRLDGAIEAMQLAVAASSPADPEAAVWVRTGLARYYFQANDPKQARALCAQVLETFPNYAPVLHLQGRLLLAAGEHVAAIDSLRRAGSINPTPEYLWVLLEALEEAGLSVEAAEVERQLRRQGPYTDPRTCALFLATRGDQTDLALRLAEKELETRQDIFARDTLAWALAARGELSRATEEISRALSEGTEDGRLFLHAAIIAERAGRIEEARSWRTKLRPLAHLLLPSERALLVDAPLAAL